MSAILITFCFLLCCDCQVEKNLSLEDQLLQALQQSEDYRVRIDNYQSLIQYVFTSICKRSVSFWVKKCHLSPLSLICIFRGWSSQNVETPWLCFCSAIKTLLCSMCLGQDYLFVQPMAGIIAILFGNVSSTCIISEILQGFDEDSVYGNGIDSYFLFI